MATVVGDRCVFLANAHVAHDCTVGNGVIFSNNVMLAGHCTVGDYVIMGGGRRRTSSFALATMPSLQPCPASGTM